MGTYADRTSKENVLAGSYLRLNVYAGLCGYSWIHELKQQEPETKKKNRDSMMIVPDNLRVRVGFVTWRLGVIPTQYS